MRVRALRQLKLSPAPPGVPSLISEGFEWETSDEEGKRMVDAGEVELAHGKAEPVPMVTVPQSEYEALLRTSGRSAAEATQAAEATKKPGTAPPPDRHVEVQERTPGQIEALRQQEMHPQGLHGLTPAAMPAHVGRGPVSIDKGLVNTLHDPHAKPHAMKAEPVRHEAKPAGKIDKK